MFFRNPRAVFLLQAAVGIASLASVLTMGRTGLALIAFLFLRPFVFRQDRGAPPDPVRALYTRTLKISLVIAGICLAGGFLAFREGFFGGVDGYLLLLLILPAYLVIHGVTGVVLAGGTAGDAGHGTPPGRNDLIE